MLDCIALTGGKYMKVHGNEVDSEPAIRSQKKLTSLEQLSYE